MHSCLLSGPHLEHCTHMSSQHRTIALWNSNSTHFWSTISTFTERNGILSNLSHSNVVATEQESIMLRQKSVGSMAKLKSRSQLPGDPPMIRIAGSRWLSCFWLVSLTSFYGKSRQGHVTSHANPEGRGFDKGNLNLLRLKNQRVLS